MEEILASIRRIIADEQQAAAPQAASAPQSRDEPARQEPARQELARQELAREEPASVDEEFERWLSSTANANFGQPKPVPAESQRIEAAAAPVTAQQPARAVLPPMPDFRRPPAAPVEKPNTAREVPAAVEMMPQAPVQTPPAASIEQELRALESRQTETVPAEPAAIDIGAPLLRPGLAAEPLMSDGAGQSIATSFQTLAQTMFLQNTGMVEDSIRGMLRPMLRQWLDDNLPVIVERLVRAEIERVARGGR